MQEESHGTRCLMHCRAWCTTGLQQTCNDSAAWDMATVVRPAVVSIYWTQRVAPARRTYAMNRGYRTKWTVQKGQGAWHWAL
jgi:hypothetical protein